MHRHLLDLDSAVAVEDRVPRPRDAVRVPDDWGDHYALCPACRNRTVIKGHSATLRCPRCAGLFQIAWDEVERS